MGVVWPNLGKAKCGYIARVSRRQHERASVLRRPRVALEFDPNSSAILLLAVDKRGKKEIGFCRSLIHEADSRFGRHFTRIQKRIEQPDMTTLQDMLDELSEDRRQRIEQRASVLIAEEKARRDINLAGMAEGKEKAVAKKKLSGMEASLV